MIAAILLEHSSGSVNGRTAEEFPSSSRLLPLPTHAFSLAIRKFEIWRVAQAQDPVFEGNGSLGDS